MPPGEGPHHRPRTLPHRLAVVADTQPPFHSALAKLGCFELQPLALANQAPYPKLMSILAGPGIELSEENSVNLQEVRVADVTSDAREGSALHRCSLRRTRAPEP